MHVLLILSQPLLASPLFVAQDFPESILQDANKDEPRVEQDGDNTKTEDSEDAVNGKQDHVDAFPTIVKEPNLRRPFLLGTNIRVRQLFLPDSALDSYVYDNDMEGALDFKRPSIGLTATGVEVVFDTNPHNWIVWTEYIGSQIDEGYWDDIELGETVDHDDGHWVRPDNLRALFFGGNYAFELPITPKSRNVWLSLDMGAGLGVGYIFGGLTYWQPGSLNAEGTCDRSSPAYVRRSTCANEPDGEYFTDGVGQFDELPRFFPMVDVTLSLKLSFANQATIRLDGGLHDLPYYGLAAGGVF